MAGCVRCGSVVSSGILYCDECLGALENKDINPSHYTGGIECIDYIQSHKMSFTEGNIVKYITRYKQKNGMQDLLKAKRYLEFLIEDYEEEV